MADFRAIPGQPITYEPAIECFSMFPNTSGDIALWGGGPNGLLLMLFSGDDKVVDVTDVTFAAAPLRDNMRRIRLTAKGIGVTVVEARLGLGGPPWAKVGVAVGTTPAQSPALSDALTAFESTAAKFERIPIER